MPERADGSPRWILKRAVKAAIAGALAGAGAHRAVGALRRLEAGGARVLVLSYHRATLDFAESAREGLSSLLVSAGTLKRQLEHVARRRDIVSLADARWILSMPPGRRPKRDVVAITFDDGYTDNHHVALPVLEALRVPATVFVATGYTGTERRMPHDRLFASLSELGRRGIPLLRAGLPPPEGALLAACAEGGPAATLDRLIARLPHPELVAIADALEARLGTSQEELPAGTRAMSWDDVRDLHAAGIDVGGHTVNHVVLANVPLPHARREIAGCRDDLAAHLGSPPRHFAYPNGYHTPGVRAAVAECGFDAAVTTEDRDNRYGGDPLAIGRKVLWENSTLGPVGYSRSLATCNVEGVFHALGVVHAVAGERPDAVDAPEALGAAPASTDERAAS